MTNLSKKFLKLIKEEKIDFQFKYNLHKINFANLNSDERIYILKESGFLIGELYKVSHIRKVTKEEREIAIRSNPTSIQYMRKQTKKERDIAISLDPNAIVWIKYATDDEKIKALTLDPSLIRCFHNPSEKIRNFVIDNY